MASGRSPDPTAAIIDRRTLRSTPESNTRAGYDGAKRKRGSKVHMAVDTLGHLLALHVAPADVGDRAAVGRLCADIQDATGHQVELAYVDQGYTGDTAAQAATAGGIALHVVKLPRGQAWICPAISALGGRTVLRVGNPMPPARQRLRTIASTLAGFHVIAGVRYMLKQAAKLIKRA